MARERYENGAFRLKGSVFCIADKLFLRGGKNRFIIVLERFALGRYSPPQCHSMSPMCPNLCHKRQESGAGTQIKTFAGKFTFLIFKSLYFCGILFRLIRGLSLAPDGFVEHRFSRRRRQRAGKGTELFQRAGFFIDFTPDRPTELRALKRSEENIHLRIIGRPLKTAEKRL